MIDELLNVLVCYYQMKSWEMLISFTQTVNATHEICHDSCNLERTTNKKNNFDFNRITNKQKQEWWHHTHYIQIMSIVIFARIQKQKYTNTDCIYILKMHVVICWLAISIDFQMRSDSKLRIVWKKFKAFKFIIERNLKFLRYLLMFRKENKRKY